MENCNLTSARFPLRKAVLLPQISQLALEGHGCREIARKLGVPKSTVSRWVRELQSMIDLDRAALIARLDGERALLEVRVADLLRAEEARVRAKEWVAEQTMSSSQTPLNRRSQNKVLNFLDEARPASSVKAGVT
jgi:transcriptional regulator with XRE-family HTH domain